MNLLHTVAIAENFDSFNSQGFREFLFTLKMIFIILKNFVESQ